MEQSKLPHSWLATVTSWLIYLISWLINHPSTILFVLSAIATIYSIRASRETIKLRKQQQDKLTSSDQQEPETET